MTKLLKLIGPYWKSVIAFLSLALTNLAANLAYTDTPWPQTKGDWVRCLALTALGTWLVYQKRNKSHGD